MDRRPRLSSAQWEQSVGFFEQNPQVARGFTRSTQARQQAAQMWERLSVLLNSEGTGVSKDAKSWSKFWNDYKCKLKKKVHDIRINMEGTGGGRALQEALSDVEIRLLAVLGENFGGQLEGVAVAPFVHRDRVSENPLFIVPDDVQHEIPQPIIEEHVNIIFGHDDGLAVIEEIMLCDSLENPLTDQPSTSQPPTDPLPPSAERLIRRGPVRRKRTRQRSRPQTAFDEAKTMLSNIETKRVEAELLNAKSFAEVVKLLARKISIDERLIAIQEAQSQQIANAFNKLAESITVIAKRGQEPAKDARLVQHALLVLPQVLVQLYQQLEIPHL